MTDVKVIGERRAIASLDRSPRAFDNAIQSTFHVMGAKLVKEAKAAIRNGPKTGRSYRVPGRRRPHRASAPGEAPANRTGRLLKSVDYEISGQNRMEFGYDSSVHYGKYLEGGTKYMAKRPNLAPRVQQNDSTFEQVGYDQLAKHLRIHGR